MTETEITVTTNEPEELRIKSYAQHLWLRCPESLRDHFDTERRGVFETAPPCFDYEEIEGKSISFTFRWGADMDNIDIPLNEHGVEEHLWVKSIRGLKYIHPSRTFNKIMRSKYPGLWEQQHFAHEWQDSGDVIKLRISWDLTKYTPPDNQPSKGL